MTRGQVIVNIRINLADAGVTFYSSDDLNDSIQDSYDDVAALSQCIVKNTTLSWQNNTTYYDFVTLGVTDYMGTTAIFNNNTNWWLRDDCSLKDFDRIRRDWELWEAQPQFWAPSDPVRIAITPRFATASGTFKLVYWATAPTLTSDSDTFLIATDMQTLIEFYVTADLLEQAQEYSKAQSFWLKYYDGLNEYSERVKRINKSDLLMRV